MVMFTIIDDSFETGLAAFLGIHAKVSPGEGGPLQLGRPLGITSREADIIICAIAIALLASTAILEFKKVFYI